MEQKSFLMSALSVGLGVGLGIGLATGRSQTFQKLTALGSSVNYQELMELELTNQVVDGKSCNVTFEEFPYYLSEQTKALLTSSAFVYFKEEQFSKYTRNLTPASRAILLSGPAEPYPQTLAKALAHYFAAKLLFLDATDFCLKLQRKHGGGTDSDSKSFPEAALDRMSSLLDSFCILPGRAEPNNCKAGTLWRQNSRLESKARDSEGSSSLQNSKSRSASESDLSRLGSSMTPTNQTSLKRASSWAFDDKLLIHSLYKVLVTFSRTSPVILYLRDVERLMFRGPKTYLLFRKMIKQLSGPILVLGSRVVDFEKQSYGENDEKMSLLLPYNIDIKPPEDNAKLEDWKSKLEEDMKAIQFQDNRNHVSEDPTNGKAEAKMEPSTENKPEGEKSDAASKGDASKKEADKDGNPPAAPPKPEVVPDNDFEKRIRPEVIPAGKIGVTFDDIGSLENVKESLQELVMLPLRRPDLFKGGLLKPCRGILLFGPPGTGKTMLAKALATEANASFINVSMSTITSKWFGEDEKNVRALFTLAAKVAPTVIFIDEVDSMLGQRSRYGEHEAMRKIKNEFMAHWDGLLSKSTERVLVLAATNRPFDLDEAIIRRFERRIMVGLPTTENREKILRTVLAKENVEEDFDFKELASMTEGYTGSDLKNICTTAAYRPVRELLKKEIEKEKAKKESMEKKEGEKGESSSSEQPTKDGEEANSSEQPSKAEEETKSSKKPSNEETKSSEEPSKEGDETKGEKKEETEEPSIKLRPLTMEDLREAKKQISPSFASEGVGMNELKEWNELYGEGGSRKRQSPTYFL
ncbi:hypothetical protein KI387_022342 [Taxus chinensis]|uniref:AAA+ ATPase domain-containing protein n=1 Tax=Taxus chinensis TaxID=29808 RepID=A0AA38L9W5_TAXCH|nr:hypothetical protein KI387_022342 [Taxus chinensis]